MVKFSAEQGLKHKPFVPLSAPTGACRKWLLSLLAFSLFSCLYKTWTRARVSLHQGDKLGVKSPWNGRFVFNPTGEIRRWTRYLWSEWVKLLERLSFTKQASWNYSACKMCDGDMTKICKITTGSERVSRDFPVPVPKQGQIWNKLKEI